jgi:hypothetical protein
MGQKLVRTKNVKPVGGKLSIASIAEPIAAPDHCNLYTSADGCGYASKLPDEELDAIYVLPPVTRVVVDFITSNLLKSDFLCAGNFFKFVSRLQVHFPPLLTPGNCRTLTRRAESDG